MFYDCYTLISLIINFKHDYKVDRLTKSFTINRRISWTTYTLNYIQPTIEYFWSINRYY